MDADASIRAISSVLLVLTNGFFVAAEYALVSCRRSRIETMARRGNRTAKTVLSALDNLGQYVAGVQVAITMCSVGVGSVAEPFITESLEIAFGKSVSPSISFAISLIFVTYLMTVLGELVPKYLSLKLSDRLALLTIRPLQIFVIALRPLVWLVQVSGWGLLRPLGIKVDTIGKEALPREELLMIIKAGSSEGVLDKVHAEMVSRALKLDELDAEDVMIHRLDIHWLDAGTPREKLLSELAKIPHTRVPVCRGDIDDIVGVVYLHDAVKYHVEPNFELEKILRPATMVPENLSLERIVQTMRETKTQIVIVLDEYGGTSGLITLEDIVEEVFGELEDRIESERSPIEIYDGGRVSARADVRFDELAAKIGFELPEAPSTDTLATVMVNALGKMPKLGDSIQTELGKMRVENMARRRITRISLQLDSPVVEDQIG